MGQHGRCYGSSPSARVNLVSNLSFGPGATHTHQPSPLAELATSELGEIVHPVEVIRDIEADRWSDTHLFSGAQKQRRLALPKWVKDWTKRRRAA